MNTSFTREIRVLVASLAYVGLLALIASGIGLIFGLFVRAG